MVPWGVSGLRSRVWGLRLRVETSGAMGGGDSGQASLQA